MAPRPSTPLSGQVSMVNSRYGGGGAGGGAGFVTIKKHRDCSFANPNVVPKIFQECL
ncbi:MAG: hypothetical protein AAF449_18590 [Myxococcota bacterium]